uniref:Uncharacterized protein n=1 Tax=Sphaerodactylus townsendi TaxID=933632 RepID=A0ACB8EGD3_9SAUR
MLAQGSYNIKSKFTDDDKSNPCPGSGNLIVSQRTRKTSWFNAPLFPLGITKKLTKPTLHVLHLFHCCFLPTASLLLLTHCNIFQAGFKRKAMTLLVAGGRGGFGGIPVSQQEIKC